jgi:hypothetical protein
MGKDVPVVTNSLYKISDRIAEATGSSKENQVSPEKNTLVSEQKKTEIPQKKEFPPERTLEFNRMRHDLEIRIEGLLAGYSRESEVLDLRKRELELSENTIRDLQKQLEQTVLPDAPEENPEKTLSRLLRSIELMRLETIRLEKKMDASRTGGNNPSYSRESSVDLMNVPNSEIMKKGFAFFFPLGLVLFFCTVILALAFIIAWKVAL